MYGDQFCGRMAAGLPITQTDFATLPPHFKNSSLSSIISKQDMASMVPGYKVLPSKFKQTIPYLIASLHVVHHSDYL